MGKSNKTISEDAAFERCINVMAELIEKYGYEEDNTYNETEEVAS